MGENEYFDDENNPFLQDDEDYDNNIRDGDNLEDPDDREYADDSDEEGYTDGPDKNEEEYADDEEYDETSDRVSQRATNEKSFRGWLGAVILALIPVAGVIYLIIKGLVKGDTSQKSTWARAMLSTELVIYMTCAVIYSVEPDVFSLSRLSPENTTTIISNSSTGDDDEQSIQDRTKKTADVNSNESKSEASDTQRITFSDGAAIDIKTSVKYTADEPSSNGDTETVALNAEDGSNLIVAVCVSGAGDNMKDMLSKKSIKETNSYDGNTKISDYKAMNNEKGTFTMCSYKKKSGGFTTYEYAFYGKKQGSKTGDYITITSDEKLQITALGFIS